MARITKKEIKPHLSALWRRLYYGADGGTGLIVSAEVFGFTVRASRCFHRGRIGPAWTPDYDVFQANRKFAVFNSDHQEPVIDFLHRQLNLEPTNV